MKNYYFELNKIFEAPVVKSTRSTRSATEAIRPPPEVIMEKVETKSALRSDETAKSSKTVSFRNRRSEIPGHELKTDESLEEKTTKKSTRNRVNIKFINFYLIKG